MNGQEIEYVLAHEIMKIYSLLTHRQAHDISTASSKMRLCATSSSFLTTIENPKKHSLPIITYKCCDKCAGM